MWLGLIGDSPLHYPVYPEQSPANTIDNHTTHYFTYRFPFKKYFFIFFRSRWTFEPNKTNNRNLKVVRFYLQYFSQYKESLFPTGNTKHLLTFDVESREFNINQLAPCHNCSTHHNFKTSETKNTLSLSLP